MGRFKFTVIPQVDLEYLEMLNNIENYTGTQDLPLESEIRQLLGCRSRMSVVTLEAGTRLIVKDETDIDSEKDKETDDGHIALYSLW